MREKEARETIKDIQINLPVTGGYRSSYATGYLEGLKKAKGLEEALVSIKNHEEYSCECNGECSCDFRYMTFKAEEALLKWEKEK